MRIFPSGLRKTRNTLYTPLRIMQQKHGRAEECGYGLLVKGQQGKMGTRNCINVAGTEKFSSCSSHKEETNPKKNTLSETGEGNVGLDLPCDAFYCLVTPPPTKSNYKRTSRLDWRGLRLLNIPRSIEKFHEVEGSHNEAWKDYLKKKNWSQ